MTLEEELQDPLQETPTADSFGKKTRRFLRQVGGGTSVKKNGQSVKKKRNKLKTNTQSECITDQPVNETDEVINEEPAEEANEVDDDICPEEEATDWRMLLSEDEVIRETLLRDRRLLDDSNTNGSLPDVLFPEAEEEINENQESLELDMAMFREMVLSQKDLSARVDTPFLITFLRARKYDKERALKMLRGYFNSRKENATLNDNLVPSILDHVWCLQLQTVLAEPDRLGRTVLLFRSNWDVNSCSLDDIFRSQMLVLEHIVRLPVTQLRGLAVVIDCGGLCLSHVYQFTPTQLKRMITVAQDVFPLRFKALHIINQPAIFEWLFAIAKPFLSETIKRRMHFHGANTSSLHEHISPEILPLEFGGEAGPLDNSRFVEIMKQEEEYFQDNFRYGHTPVAPPESTGNVGTILNNYYRNMCID